MWVSDKWRDFELLDCSRGEKLERWGRYTVVRPDPQAIWDTPRSDRRWQHCDGRYTRSASGGGSWDRGSLPASWQISYGELKFNVKPMSFKHTGLFPGAGGELGLHHAQDPLRRKAGQRAQPLCVYRRGHRGALAAGASVCHVDAAKGMVAWAKENAASSGVADRSVRWIVDDCAKFVEREIRRGRRYDAIIMDPPSYGRGPGGEVWKIEDNLWDFVSLTAGVLSDDPLFVIINSYTTGLSPSVLTYIAESVFTRRFGGRSESRELGLPVTSTGLCLPCGAACRWETVER